MTKTAGYLLLFCCLAPAFAKAAELHPLDQAEVHEHGSVLIIDPWAKSQIGGAHEAKLFFEFRNKGQLPDELIAVNTPIANGDTHFIVVSASGEERQLKQVESIKFPSGPGPYELSEVGYYVEITGLETPVLMGKRFPVELTFKNAGTITIEFTARFHSPKLTRRIKEAAAAGDIDALNALRPISD